MSPSRVLLSLFVAAASRLTTAEALVSCPLLNGFETPEPLASCNWAGKVEPAEPSVEAKHSGAMGLRLHFAGAPGVHGSQYLATWSARLGLAEGVSFWLRVADNPGKSTFTVTVASADYLVQWHHRVDLAFTGWQEIRLSRQDFDPGAPAGRIPDWEENHYLYFTFDGPDPVTLHLDDVELLLPPEAMGSEPLATNDVNPLGTYLYNSRVQVVVTRKTPRILHRVTAFRRVLVGPASVLADGVEVAAESLAQTAGRLAIGGRDVQLTGDVAARGDRAQVRVAARPPLPLGYRLPLDPEAYAGQSVALDDRPVGLDKGPAGILARADEVRRVTVGSLSQRQLVLKLKPGISVAVRRDHCGRLLLDLESPIGDVGFSFAAPQEWLALTLSTDRYHNVFDWSDRRGLALHARLANHSGRQRRASLEATLTDFAGQTVWRTADSRQLIPAEPAELVFRPAIDRAGFYKLVLTATDTDDGETFREFMTLGVVHPVDTPGPTRQDGRFGLTFFCRTPELARLAGRLGITWSRDNIYWSGMEPERGRYTWTAMDRYVENAAAGNLWTMPVNGGEYGAAWARLPEQYEDRWGKAAKVDLEAWARWWSLLAERYRGKVGAWELANETYYIKSIPLVVDTHRAAYRAIKARDPHVPVVANVCGVGTDWTVDFTREFLAQGGYEGCDVIACHPYLGFRTSPEAAHMREVSRALRQLAGEYGKALWWTEYAWFGDDEWDPCMPGVETDWTPNIISERAQAQFIVRSFLAGLREDVPHMFYFLDQDNRSWRFPAGILREEGIRPAVCALNALCRTMEFTTWVQDVTLADGVEVMVCRGDGRATAALWRTVDEPLRVVLPVHPHDVAVTDFMGNPVRAAWWSRHVTLSLDGCPVYVVSNTLSPEALAAALARGRGEAPPAVSVGRVFLTPDVLQVELRNAGPTAAKGRLRVLEPLPATWSLQAASAPYAVPSGGAARVTLRRDGPLPAAGHPARLRLQPAAQAAVEREYRLLPVPRAAGGVSVADDPSSWGPPTLALDSADRTMSCPKLETPSPDWHGPQDLSARLWLRWDTTALYVGLAVQDDEHSVGAATPAELWQFDSVQYGFDAAGDADPGGTDGWDGRNDCEWLAGFFQGSPTLWCHANPGARPPGPVAGVTFSQRRVGQTTLYTAAFPWHALPPAAGEPGTLLGLNLIVNDNDGPGRKGWIGITPGMGESKAPGRFMRALLLP